MSRPSARERGGKIAREREREREGGGGREKGRNGEHFAAANFA